MIVEDNFVYNSIAFTACGPLQLRQDTLKRTDSRFQCRRIFAGDRGSLIVVVAKLTLDTGRGAALTRMNARTADLLR
jgi:hypothetical protein